LHLEFRREPYMVDSVIGGYINVVIP
jgi:hypothetical protein